MTADTWIERDKALYEVVAGKLVAAGFKRLRRRAGDIFTRRADALRVQLTRPLGELEWRVCEIGTMRPVGWDEIRAHGAEHPSEKSDRKSRFPG